MESVVLEGLGRRFGDVWAVDGVDLTVHEGEFFGLLGPNGAGKSTTIKMVTGLLTPTTGRSLVLGKDVTVDPLAVKRSVGLLPEELALYDRLTGAEYVAFSGRMYGLDETTVQRRTGELLELLELGSAGEKVIMDYSYGMKKKVGLAAALVHAPRVLFLDEPFNGIDVVSMRGVRNVLQELTGRGMTVFFSSHVMEVVEKLCHRVAIMHKGKVAAVGTVDELKRSMPSGDALDLEEVFVHVVGEGAPQRRLSWLT